MRVCDLLLLRLLLYIDIMKALFVALPVGLILLLSSMDTVAAKPSPLFTDTTINTFTTERLCWSKESCKEEFQSTFTCRCPEWSYCSGPGRYYNAYCSVVKSGYIWAQQFNRSTTKT